MGLTITKVDNSALANKRVVFAEVAFDSSYPTGGEALTANTLGLLQIDYLVATGKNGYLFEYDYANGKLKAMTPVGAASATLNIKDNDNAGTAGVAVYFDEDGTAGQRLQFVSPTNANGTDACVTVAAAAAAEVGNAVNLAALTGVKIMAIGV